MEIHSIAKALQETRNYDEAAMAFDELGDYSDAKSQKKNCILIKFKDASIGTTVSFGKYDWQVLEKTEDKALLISKDCVEKRAYNEEGVSVTWETSTIRKYLNEEFYNNTFTKEEQSLIAETKIANKDNPEYDTSGGNDTNDKIFLLSIEEAEQYFKNDYERVARYNGYIRRWWLRSPGFDQDCAAHVYDSGLIDEDGYGVNNVYGIRPALWLNLKS